MTTQSVPLPVDRIIGFEVRPETAERIHAGHQAFINEVKPTRRQLEHGLDLHYDSYVGDVHGSVSMTYIGGLAGERLRKDLEPIRKQFEEEGHDGLDLHRKVGAEHYRWKIFESEFDPQWIEESKALSQIAGVH